MTTYRIKRGRTKTGRRPGFLFVKPAIKKLVMFSQSYAHDVVHSHPGDLFGIRSLTGKRAIKFGWEYDHRFHQICLYAVRVEEGKTDQFVLGFVPLSVDVKLDMLMSDTYVVFSVSHEKKVASMSKFVPFEFMNVGMEVLPTFPVKAPHNIEILID